MPHLWGSNFNAKLFLYMNSGVPFEGSISQLYVILRCFPHGNRTVNRQNGPEKTLATERLGGGAAYMPDINTNRTLWKQSFPESI